jgi:hypothetical protein
MLKRFANASPRLKARIAGALYLSSLATASITEIFLTGALNIAGGLIAILGMGVVTLLLYGIFKVVSQRIAFLSATLGFVGLVFEILRSQPQGVNVAVVLNGVYCILLGFLILRSAIMPRVLGVLMALAGLSWLTFLWPDLLGYLSPYNLASGVLCEVSMFIWLLFMGVNVLKRDEPDAF